MKNFELYKKCTVGSASVKSSSYTMGNVMFTALVIIAVLLVEPLIMYKYHRRIPFTLEYYIHQIEYFSVILIPLGGLILWTNWREALRQNRGYGWVGKFEVLDKQANLFSYYLLLAPGHGNKIKINRRLFYMTRVGDFVTITRDALGAIKEIKRTRNIKSRLKNTSRPGLQRQENSTLTKASRF